MMGSYRDGVRRVTPYVPGEQPNAPQIIKLNTNENPYPPSPAVQQVLREESADALRLYPDPNARVLKEALAKACGVRPEQIYVAVGSDEVLALSFMTFFNASRPILFPDITYSFYEVWAQMLRIPYRTVPLDAKFYIRPADYAMPCGGIVFPNPNAPTGELLPLSAVEEILMLHPDAAVIVDEAYIDFGGESALPLLKKYENLLIVQTFSKSRALAGARIGFAVGNEEMIRCLTDVSYSFNSYMINRLSADIGAAAVRDGAYYEKTIQKIIATRERTKTSLRDLGFSCGDSKSNFLFVTHPDLPAETLFSDLKKAGIYVRHFSHPARINNYLRITIGTDEQMQALLSFLKTETVRRDVQTCRS